MVTSGKSVTFPPAGSTSVFFKKTSMWPGICRRTIFQLSSTSWANSPLPSIAAAAPTSMPNVEDVTSMYMTFPNQRSAMIHSSWLDPRKIREMTIVGSKRMIVYDDVAPLEKIRIYRCAGRPAAPLRHVCRIPLRLSLRRRVFPLYQAGGTFENGMPAFSGLHPPGDHAADPMATGTGTGSHFGSVIRIVEAGRCAGGVCSPAEWQQIGTVDKWKTARDWRFPKWPRPGLEAKNMMLPADPKLRIKIQVNGQQGNGHNGNGNGNPASRLEAPMSSSETPCLRVAPDVKLGKNVRLIGFVNLYGCEIGDDVKIGTFVEIQKGAKIGNRCKISSHSFHLRGGHLGGRGFRRPQRHFHQ